MVTLPAASSPRIDPVRGGTLTSRARAAAASARPRLTVLARPEPRRSSVPFTILCSLILAGTLLALLFLNISMSDTSYEITRLQSQSRALADEKQSLQETDQQLGTPQELLKRAQGMGMVPASDPAYVDLATGKVIGDPQPAAGPANPASPATSTASTPASAQATSPAPGANPAPVVDGAPGTQQRTYHGMGGEKR